MSDEADRPGATETDAPGGVPTAGEREGERAAAASTAATRGRRGTETRQAYVTTGDTTVIVRTVARIVSPIVLLLAVSLTVRGHNLPGGGCIGGVLTAIAVVLLYVVFGVDYVRDRLVPRAERWNPSMAMVSGGLALALAAGLAPVLVGSSFLEQGFYIAPEPLPGPFFHEFEVASALAFDVGVYLVVVGGLLTVVREVGSE